MSSSSYADDADLWADWLITDRFAGDASHETALRAAVADDVERLLTLAHLQPGTTLLDIGTGDGEVALHAIDRVNGNLRAILTDISPRLLDAAKHRAHAGGVASHCTFMQRNADALDGIADASVDLVTTRAVLGYLPDKPAAFREFWRVLKPGGRIALAEPIRRDEAFEAASLRTLCETLDDSEPNRFFKLLHRWKSAQFPDTEETIRQMPVTSFIERDLVRLALDSGFAPVHMELHIDVRPALIQTWDVALRSTPFPWSPTLETILAQRFTADERAWFEAVYRPQFESGSLVTAERIAYLIATRPAR